MGANDTNAKAVPRRKLQRALWAVWLALGCVSVRGAQPKQPKPPAERPAANPQQKQAARTQAQAANQQARAARQALNAPRLMRLAQMSPEERAAALAKLPPGQRQQLEQHLENFSKLPPEQQARAINQYQRMEALPPERREQVREALTQYNSIQPPRKGVIALEMTRLSTMSPEFRADYMGKPVFRKQFSEAEIRMMNDLQGIVP